jgi:hypothetical protein
MKRRAKWFWNRGWQVALIWVLLTIISLFGDWQLLTGAIEVAHWVFKFLCFLAVANYFDYLLCREKLFHYQYTVRFPEQTVIGIAVVNSVCNAEARKSIIEKASAEAGYHPDKHTGFELSLIGTTWSE